MLKRGKRLFVLGSILVVAAVLGGGVAFHSEAQAEEAQAVCIFQPEALFVLDRDADRCAYITRDIPDWSVIGMRSAADLLHNQATRHDVIVRNGSTIILIRRGQQLFTRNFGTGNNWIPARP